MVRGLKDLSKTYSGQSASGGRIYPSSLGGGGRLRSSPQYGARLARGIGESTAPYGGPAYPRLASGLGGIVSSRGLVLSTTMKNAFVSEDLGVVLPLNGNLDEPLYLGQIR